MEPEAASIFCQELRMERDAKTPNTFSETIKFGTKYLVIDLGGMYEMYNVQCLKFGLSVKQGQEEFSWIWL